MLKRCGTSSSSHEATRVFLNSSCLQDMVRQAENHKKETDRLQVKCDVALSRRDELIVELHTLKETHSNCDPMSRKTREEHEEALVELKVMLALASAHMLCIPMSDAEEHSSCRRS